MKQTHTTIRFELTLHIPAGGYASAGREAIAHICREKLLPELDRLFDSWAGPDEYIVLDKLEIIVTAKSIHELELNFVDQVIKKISAQFDPSVSYSAPNIVFHKKNKEQYCFERWLYFLRHGRLPNAVSIKNEREWEQDVLEMLAAHSDAKQKCIDLFKEQPSAITRLLSQFQYEFLKKWVAAFGGYPSMRLYELTHHWIQLMVDPFIIQSIRDIKPAFKISADFVRDSWYCLVKTVIEGGETQSEQVIIKKLLRYSFDVEDSQLIVRLISNLEKGTDNISYQAKQALDQLKAFFADINESIHNETKTLPQENKDRQAARDATRDDPHQESSFAIDSKSSVDVKPSDDSKSITGTKDGENIISNETINKYQAENIFSEKRNIDPDHPVSPEVPQYIDNSGLVILHPYLLTLFDCLNLLHEQKFKDPPARDKAVQLLSWLTYGTTGLPEHQLLLFKILCGIPLEQPVDRFIELTDMEMKEADSLLKAVIANWKAIGNTSPDGLRANFLLREGRLEWLKNEWRLRVTQTAPDILLERLPWSISIVRLPWMPYYLKTEWV